MRGLIQIVVILLIVWLLDIGLIALLDTRLALEVVGLAVLMAVITLICCLPQIQFIRTHRRDRQ